MKENVNFFSFMKNWLLFCQINGLFPFRIRGSSLAKGSCYVFHTIRCYILFIGNELYFSHFKYNFSFFGWMYELIDLFFVILWLVFWFRNNTLLVEIFSLFDQFDAKFKAAFGRTLRQKCMLRIYSVITLLALYALNFVAVTILVVVNNHPLFIGFLFSTFRTVEKSLFVLFIALHLYLVYSLKFRFENLKFVWNDVIARSFNVCRNYDPRLAIKIAEIRLLYQDLCGIVDAINCCLGSRIIVLYGQLFNFILMNFYLMFSGIKLPICVLPFYVIPPLLMCFSSQNLYSSANMSSNLFAVSLDKLPERLILMIYAFAQQLRSCPVKIDAAGFFHLNQTFFFSIFFSMASYLVAIFQLVPLVNRITSKTAVSIL